MTPDEQRLADIRNDCLAMAINSPHNASGGGSATHMVRDAEAYLAFVTGAIIPTPRGKIDAALDAAGVR